MYFTFIDTYVYIQGHLQKSLRQPIGGEGTATSLDLLACAQRGCCAVCPKQGQSSALQSSRKRRDAVRNGANRQGSILLSSTPQLPRPSLPLSNQDPSQLSKGQNLGCVQRGKGEILSTKLWEGQERYLGCLRPWHLCPQALAP